MPTCIDVHTLGDGVPAAEVAAGRKADLETQNAYDVNYKRYWANKEGTKIFCLVDAPDPDTAVKAHREAHGLVAGEIFEMEEG